MQTVKRGAATRIEGRLTRHDRDRDPYLLVPFRVPPGVRGLEVRLRHDPAGDADRPDIGAVIDLGLIGPGPTTIGTEAFRGWSGSERSVVRIGRRSATPGYRAGPIASGTWHAILGLYAIPDEGATFWLDVELLDADPRVEAPAAAASSPDPAPVRSPVPLAGTSDEPWRWFACDLHAHSLHSDGIDDIEGLRAAARRRGLDVLFVSDHNTTSQHRWLERGTARPDDTVLLPAEEVTTYRGHMNAIGSTEWVDFRHRDREGIVRAIEAVHRGGGLASINHPRRNPCSWEWGDVPMDLVEVWNGSWSDADEATLTWWYELVAVRLAARDGGSPTPVGGSDCHDAASLAAPLGGPVTWVRAVARDRAAIVAGLAAARTALTDSPAEPPPAIRRQGPSIAWDLPPAAGRRLVLRGPTGVSCEIRLDDGSRAEWPTDEAASGPVAAEIRGPHDRVHALVPLIERGD